MFPNTDNVRGMEAVRQLLDSRSSKNPSTEWIMEGLEICLLNNYSRFANIDVPNSCSYSDIAISDLDKIIHEKRATQFQECFYFSRYRDDIWLLWCG